MAIAKNLRVLIVDDQDSMRRLHRFSLKQLGISEAKETANGKDALDALRSQPFDLVMCDWNMQPVDGLAVFKAMQADPSLRGVPFLMITGNVSEAEVKKAITAGIRLYLGKPYNVKALQARIEKAVGKLS